MHEAIVPILQSACRDMPIGPRFRRGDARRRRSNHVAHRLKVCLRSTAGRQDALLLAVDSFTGMTSLVKKSFSFPIPGATCTGKSRRWCLEISTEQSMLFAGRCRFVVTVSRLEMQAQAKVVRWAMRWFRSVWGIACAGECSICSNVNSKAQPVATLLSSPAELPAGTNCANGSRWVFAVAVG